ARAWKYLGRTGREADAWHRLGEIRAEAGDWQGALEAESRASGLYRTAGARQSEVLSLDRIADAWQGLGELEEAERARREALAAWRSLGENWNVAAASYRLCQLAHLAGRAWEALQCYELVLQGWRKLRCREEEGMVRVDAGTLYASLGDLDRALDSFREALALIPEGSAARSAALTQIGNTFLRAGFPWRALLRFRQAGGSASALNGMGLAWQRLGKPGRALPLFERSLALLDTPAARATVWCNIGRLHLSLDQPGSAMTAFERALSVGRGDRASRAEALSGLARAARLQGRWDTARSRMEQALAEIESLRSDVGHPSRVPGQRFLVDLLKATYLASKQDDYAFLIDLLMERGYDREALDVNERALARSLSDSFEPALAPPPWPSLLDEDTALLEYSLGEQRSFLWWVTRNGHASFELPGREVLEKAARRLYGLVSCPRTSRYAIHHQSRKVAGLLLGPVAPRLRQRRLVIVAPDILQYVPFEALLLDRHEVFRVPSATVLARLRNRSAGRGRSQGLGLLGDGVFSPLDGRLPSGTRGEERGPKRLPWVTGEVRSILKSAGNRKVLAATGFDAVPEVAVQGALGSFPILHLNGHGRIDPKRPEQAGVLLSSYDRRARPRPGWLTAAQVRELRLQADIVVLSACRTGLGREVRGEGLVGLSQSFLAAGASSVVASLWNVDDRATAALMDRFYDELLHHGRPPAEALRRAQLSLRSVPRWRAPYYWGGFVLQGDGLNNARSGGSP
ncbi:MAG: CHAT domain-containing protein, partial [Thermoanaerobaculia bacterium]